MIKKIYINYQKKQVMNDVETLFGLKIATVKENSEGIMKDSADLHPEYSKDSTLVLTITITHILNNKCGVNFSSYAHTALPVSVLVKGVGDDSFNGYYDNTEIYNRLAKLVGVN